MNIVKVVKHFGWCWQKKNIFFLCFMGKCKKYFINLHGVHKLRYTQLSDTFYRVFMNIVKVYVVMVYKRIFKFAFSIWAHFMKLCTTWYFINLHELAIGDQRLAFRRLK